MAGGRTWRFDCRVHNHRLFLQTKCKAADKTLEQYFLKEFKATCKKAGETELTEIHLGQLSSEPFNCHSLSPAEQA